MRRDTGGIHRGNQGGLEGKIDDGYHREQALFRAFAVRALEDLSMLVHDVPTLPSRDLDRSRVDSPDRVSRPQLVALANRVTQHVDEKGLQRQGRIVEVVVSLGRDRQPIYFPSDQLRSVREEHDET